MKKRQNREKGGIGEGRNAMGNGKKMGRIEGELREVRENRGKKGKCKGNGRESEEGKEGEHEGERRENGEGNKRE